MRGSPILRALLAFVALLALAPLLWRITHPAASAGGQVSQPASQPAWGTKVAVRISFSIPPTRVTIRHLGKDVWSKASPALEELFAAEIPWPKEGVDLSLAVEWPAGTKGTAARVRLTSPDGTEHDRTVWGDPMVDEVLTFK